MLQLRPNVSLWNLQPQGLFILKTVESVFLELLGPAVACTVTSGADGEHMPGSYHPQGLAFDFSLQPVVAVSKVGLCVAIAHRLGGSARETRLSPTQLLYDGGDFDVLLDDLGLPNEHAHVEFDRKRAAARLGITMPAALVAPPVREA